ncbi:MAG: ATP phosphoribosyltransferase regulatory subunit [Limnochordaceae bacterium]|nr:ATP phosphoribosyltransferase regulatory subunit [Limnochordaceae bacterium]
MEQGHGQDQDKQARTGSEPSAGGWPGRRIGSEPDTGPGYESDPGRGDELGRRAGSELGKGVADIERMGEVDIYEWPYTRVQTPRGMRDLLPDQVKRRRALEAALREVFAEAGYQEVETPLLEYADVVAAGNLRADEASGATTGSFDVYRLFDPERESLVLRPDMTTPIARLAATRLARWPRPLRLYYLADVFRFEEVHAGRLRQFRQAGVERIGEEADARTGGAAESRRDAADAEIVALAVRLLTAAGLQRFRIDIGHVGLVHALLDAGGWQPRHRRALRQALMERNQVALQAVLAEAGTENVSAAQQAARWQLVELPQWCASAEIPAPAERALSALRLPAVDRALQELHTLLQCVAAAKVPLERVGIDLGLVRDLNYYTGPVLEGFSPDLALPLLTGGRYDHLVEQFAPRPEPATGFAVGLDRLELALDRQANSR